MKTATMNPDDDRPPRAVVGSHRIEEEVFGRAFDRNILARKKRPVTAGTVGKTFVFKLVSTHGRELATV